MANNDTPTPRHGYAVTGASDAPTAQPVRDVVAGDTTLSRRDPALSFRYIHAWQQWEWWCLHCNAKGLRSDSRYNRLDTIKVAMRHECR
jgi:hypothetical protein